jgi:deoxyribose-phosphate aldolase
MYNIADKIDHTILKPELPFGAYTEGVRDCVKHDFASFCVNPQFVQLINNLLKNHPECKTVPCSVISFPFGSTILTEKLVELNNAIFDGAKEVDFVANISAIKTGDWNKVATEFRTLKDSAWSQALLKVILEVGVLTDDEIKRCCDLAVEHKLDFVKTSTGFHSNKLEPAQTARYVKLMADHVRGSGVLVKASGGIKTLSDARLMLEAGASRIGTSSGVSIMEELQNG